MLCNKRLVGWLAAWGRRSISIGWWVVCIWIDVGSCWWNRGFGRTFSYSRLGRSVSSKLLRNRRRLSHLSLVLFLFLQTNTDKLGGLFTCWDWKRFLVGSISWLCSLPSNVESCLSLLMRRTNPSYLTFLFLWIIRNRFGPPFTCIGLSQCDVSSLHLLWRLRLSNCKGLVTSNGCFTT